MDDRQNRPLLRVVDLEVSYRGRRRRRPVDAVRGVTFEVGRGQVVGLIGESGSGKSSIGAAILGLTPARGGRIEFDGEDITHAKGARRRELASRIQVVFQDPYGSMNPARTVGDSLTETLRYGLGTARTESEERLATALRAVGLPESASARYPAQFSGGQRQRLAIARALITEPDFIVCDEPTSALDLSVQAQILNLLARLRESRGLSYLFITHNLNVVKYVSDQIVVLRNGEVVERAAVADFAHSPHDAYTRALILAAPVSDPVDQRLRRAERHRSTRPAGPAAGA